MACWGNKRVLTISYGLFQMIFLLAFTLLSVTDSNGASTDSTSIPSIAKVLTDLNRDKKPDFLGNRFTISGRATVSSSVFDDHYLIVYIQDQSAGIMVFADTLKKDVSIGDSLIVTGELQLYSGKPEIVVDNYEIIEAESRIPSPVELDLAFEHPKRYSGMLVGGRAVIIEMDFETNTAMVRIAPENSSDHSLYAFLSRSNTAYQDFDIDVLSVGDQIFIEGILERHYSEYADRSIHEVLLRTPDDIRYIGLPRQYRDIILWIGAVFAVVIAGWIVLLKKKVNTQTKELSQALREKEILLQEIHHRVKNNLAVISGLLELQKHEPVNSVDILIEDTQYRIQSIGMVHEKLYQAETLSDIDVREYIEDFSDMVLSLIHI